VWHHELRAAEDVDDIERPGLCSRLGQGSECRDPEDTPFVRVDRDALESLVDEIAEDPERWASLIRRCSDDRNPPRPAEDLLDLVVLGDADRSAALLEVEIGDRSRLLLAPRVLVRAVRQVAPSLT
jgi:hypothetical protein